jgi:hypothetical protein
MLAKKLSFLFLPFLFTTGCTAPYSETPTASNFLSSKQLKLQATEHWQIIANDMAKNIAQSYANNNIVIPILLKSSENESTFNRTLKHYLSTALVKNGLTVLIKPEGGFYELDVQTQVLRFNPKRLKANTNGVATTLATGVWSIDNAKVTPFVTRRDGNSDDTTALNEFFWSDSMFSQGEVPQQEIIISTNLTNQKQYIISDMRSYYISDADSSLYQPEYTSYPISLTDGN